MNAPRWIKDARVGELQSDESGQFWRIVSVNEGGRYIVWECVQDGRKATSRINANHPDYPTDDHLLEQQRAVARAAKQHYRRYGYYP